DLGIGLVQLALRGVHGIAGGVVRLPARFELGLAGTQAGDRGFQIVLGLGDFLVFTLALFARAGFFQQPQGKLLFLAIGLQFAVLPRHFGLRLELFQLAAQLAQDVLDAGEVLARVGQAVLGFAAALFISRHAGGLFQEHAQFFGARLDQAVDHALPDNGVTPGAQAGAQENIVDIPAPHLLIVDVIAAGAVARQYAAHRDFGIGAPLAGRPAFAVVENHFDRRARRRLAVSGAVENDVLHGLAAQFGRLGLAQHPPYGVDNIRLAAAVRPHHAHQLAGNGNHGGIDERFEAGEF